MPLSSSLLLLLQFHFLLRAGWGGWDDCLCLFVFVVCYCVLVAACLIVMVLLFGGTWPWNRLLEKGNGVLPVSHHGGQ